MKVDRRAEKETKKGEMKASRKVSMNAQETKSLNYIPLPKKSRLQRESEHRTLVENEHSECSEGYSRKVKK